jgi:transcriptional regulator with XRE-family HTH domain
MPRRKTIPELRDEIMASEKLRGRPQDTLSQRLGIHQATLSRILRGKFQRYSPAVEAVCKYACISCMTSRPLDELDASIHRLSALAQGGATRERQALKLIRLAAELLKAEAPSYPPSRRQRVAS